MAKTKSELFTLIGANLPDNSNGAITPEKLREVTTQIADSMLYAATGVKEVELLRASSLVNQVPTTLGTAIQVSFGGAQKSSSDPVMISATGVVTFNATGVYIVTVDLQCGRDAVAGLATLLSRFVLSGTQYGESAALRLDNVNNIIPMRLRFVLSANATQTLITQFLRDSSSTGVNVGGLYVTTPAATGWAACPSARIVISRLEPV